MREGRDFDIPSPDCRDPRPIPRVGGHEGKRRPLLTQHAIAVCGIALIAKAIAQANGFAQSASGKAPIFLGVVAVSPSDVLQVIESERVGRFCRRPPKPDTLWLRINSRGIEPDLKGMVWPKVRAANQSPLRLTPR